MSLLSLDRPELFSELLLPNKFIDFHGLRITPPFLIFENVFEQEVYYKNITFMNISNKLLIIKVPSPNSYVSIFPFCFHYTTNRNICLYVMVI